MNGPRIRRSTSQRFFSCNYTTPIYVYFQIELDLLRTLPHNVYYDKLTSDGIPKLRRILLAYTRHNPDIGYCQVRHVAYCVLPGKTCDILCVYCQVRHVAYCVLIAIDCRIGAHDD